MRRQVDGLRCPFAAEHRVRLPVADRHAGYAPETIVLGDRHEVRQAALQWLNVLLRFHGGLRCWVLHDPAVTDARLDVVERNASLRNPADVVAAQRWAASVVEASDVARQERAAADEGWLSVPAAPARVTEWRAVVCAGRPFYAPLFNVTSVCSLPVRDVLPATGADCACLVVDGGGDG
ncbi:hypothetical protein ACTI_31500 [Actinoplanes sp. OR16]|uniref:hypothetical protein n=1 Tax=Actinoplanes sp. OR16 TaxID=946334 RepID=UPI000F713A86|nr:hypothetical protein [Actinoplanes sp. OR16]BBH66465.1 hypothetical protein ACTI_31500 [Actinoplanes sp. OR16]